LDASFLQEFHIARLENLVRLDDHAAAATIGRRRVRNAVDVEQGDAAGIGHEHAVGLVRQIDGGETAPARTP
jgi:hypothetical protein